jgi:hypothetical protein
VEELLDRQVEAVLGRTVLQQVENVCEALSFLSLMPRCFVKFGPLVWPARTHWLC